MWEAGIGKLCINLLLISAPAEKNLPSPVRTVKMVSGCSSSSRIAVIVSSISFPPKEFRDLGRLSYCQLAIAHRHDCGEITLIIPIWPVISTTMSLYVFVDMVRVFC